MYKIEKNTPVWKKKRSKVKKSFKLTPEQKQEAKERAEKAGRRYPNLVDNMYVARKYQNNNGGKVRFSEDQSGKTEE